MKSMVLNDLGEIQKSRKRLIISGSKWMEMDLRRRIYGLGVGMGWVDELGTTLEILNISGYGEVLNAGTSILARAFDFDVENDGVFGIVWLLVLAAGKTLYDDT